MNLDSLGRGLTATFAAWVAMELPDLVPRPSTHSEDILPFSAIWLAGNDNPALRCLVSTAYMLAGRVRCGNSDWLLRRLDATASAGETSSTRESAIGRHEPLKHGGNQSCRDASGSRSKQK